MKRYGWMLVCVVSMLGVDSARAELKIERIQAAYGRFGPVRKTLTVSDQDEIYFYFDILGVQTDDEGKIDQVIRLEIKDPEGKTVLNKDNPVPRAQTLGGGRLPGMASVTFGTSGTPGPYTLTVTAIDKLSGSQASFQRTLNYQPGGFHIAAPQFSYDAEGKVLAPVGGVEGQTLYLRLKAVGLDPQAVKLDTAMSMQVVDSSGKEAFPKPLVAVVREDDATKVRQIQFVTFNASFALTRPGDFTLRIQVEDRVAKKISKFEAPLHIGALPAIEP